MGARKARTVGRPATRRGNSSASTMSQPTFTPNERVLCYHGPLIYEAKVLKAETWDESTSMTGIYGPHFFVHYKGWKQTLVQVSLIVEVSLTDGRFFLLYCFLACSR